jgi:hypothetical protein
MVSILNKNFIPFLLITVFLFQSCSHKEPDKGKTNPYSISLGAFKNYERAFQFKSTLSTKVRANLRLEYVSKKNYKLLYGRFPNSITAGQKAYELLCDTLIADYDITRNGFKVLDEFINIPFVANFIGKPCLFNYNIRSKSTELLWSQKDEKVVSLNLTEDANYAFITTARSSGRIGGLPYVRDANLYFLHRIEDNVEQLDELGDGYQIYTYWDSPDSFRVNYSYSDVNNPRIIYQQIRTWDSFGRKRNGTERSFDILKQGFPAPPDRKPQRISPNHNYELRLVPNAGQTFFYLKDYAEKSEVLIASTYDRVKDIRWSGDGNYLFIITEHKSKADKKRGETRSHIYIVNAYGKKVKKILEGTGYENLLVRGKLVFFDELFNGAQRISIYDYKLNKRFGFIDMPGGCALNTFTY